MPGACFISSSCPPVPEGDWHHGIHSSHGEVGTVVDVSFPERFSPTMEWRSDRKNQRIHLTLVMRVSLLWWLQWEIFNNCHSVIPITWVTITSDTSNKGWVFVAWQKWHGADGTPLLGSSVQHSRTLGHVPSASTLSSSDEESFCDAQVGQHNRCGLHMETGWNPQQLPATRGRANHELGSKELFQHFSSLHTWDPKCSVRFSFRVLMNNKWVLHKEVFEWLLTRRVSSEVNLFVSPCNNKLAMYYWRF